jgi:hypothetical protein
MLLAMYEAQAVTTASPAQFFDSISALCRAQKASDLEYHVPWSRYLTASLCWGTGCELLVGASAVTYNPHFPHFVSLYPSDECLGAVKKWPPGPALLVIDSFAPRMRGPVLEKVAAHRLGVWVLKQHDGNPKESVLVQLRRVARLQAESLKNSRVLHQVGSWETAAWDVESSRFSTQLWKLNITAEAMQQIHHPGEMQQLLDCEGYHRYAFYWGEDPTPLASHPLSASTRCSPTLLGWSCCWY